MALNDDKLLVPSFMDQANGSVFVGTNTSYSGADIKVVMHIYDGGKLSEERQSELNSQVAGLNNQLTASKGELNQIQKEINSGSFSSGQVDRFNALSTLTTKQQNTLDFLNDEITRIGKNKPQFSTKVLAECQTLSISSHREKTPVRSLGSIYPKGFTRGSRTIAGSMIFTVFDRNVIDEFLETHPSDFDINNPATTALIDQVSPFDITIAFANELGQVSRMAIYGIEFVNEGQTMSIEDLLLENVTQFVAADYDPMRPVGRRKIDENNRLSQEMIPLRASALLGEQDYQDYKNKISPYERFSSRKNPFV